MADLRLYPNLPGVVSSISVETQVPTFDDSKPKFLLLGWHSQDKFQDGTPIKFNEPYFVINDTMLSDMFETTEKLGLHAKIVGTTANWEVIPVVVRTGKPDVKVGGAETEAAVTLAQPANNKVTVADVAEVSWVGEPTWRSNYSLKVTVDASKNASVYLNGSETPLITGPAATGLYIPQLGLTVKALNDDAEQTAYFKFQYASEPATDDDKIQALEAALTELRGLEVDYVYQVDQVLDDNGSTKHFGSVLAEYANTQSNQFRNVLVYLGTSEPANYTFSGIKAWVNRLRNYMDTNYKNGVLDQQGQDVGHRIVVVAGHGYVNDVSNVTVDLASFVAAKLHANKVYNGPINMALDGITLLENITLEQANLLSAARITALYNKPGYNKIPTILVGKTLAGGTSPMTKISSILVINEYVNGLRDIADRYLGQPNSGTVRMSMQSTMQNFTNSFRQSGKIAGGSVTVEPDSASGQINALNVKAQIRAFAEIEVININVRFEYQLG